MLRSALALATAGIVVATSVTGAAARGPHRMAIFDAQSGKKIYDDGKLDGKACVIGKRAVYNPKTGVISVVPAAKCNF